MSINGVKSELLENTNGVPKGSILEPLFILIYINDLDKAISFSKMHHFVDDTNLLYKSKSLKDIDKKIKYDMSKVTTWLMANIISLNVPKIVIIIFRPVKKNINKKTNFLIRDEKMKTKKQIKYLGTILDEHLLFKHISNQLFQMKIYPLKHILNQRSRGLQELLVSLLNVDIMFH